MTKATKERYRWHGRWFCSNHECQRTGQAGEIVWKVNPFNGCVVLCCPYCGSRVFFLDGSEKSGGAKKSGRAR